MDRDRRESNRPTDETEDADADDEHLADLPDGAGCTGIWEYLSERRDDDD